MSAQAMALSALVVAMMLAVGFDLRPVQLLEGLRRGRAIAALVLLNVVGFPLVTWGVVSLLGFEGAVMTGALLCAAAPGGATGALFSSMAKGDLGFATAGLVALGVIGLVTAPLTMALVLGGSGGGAELAWGMGETLALYQILPLFLAMGVRRAWPTVAAKLARPTAMVANALLLAIIVWLLVERGELLLETPPPVHGVLIGVLLLCLAPVAIAKDPSGLWRSGAIVTGVRNLSVALLLAKTFFREPGTDVVILVWGFWMMVLPAVAALWRGRRGGPPAPQGAGDEAAP